MIANALLIRWVGGWHVVEDSDSIAAHGRRELLLGLGALPSVEEAERVGRGQLARYADVRAEIAVGFAPPRDAPDDLVPFLGLNVGDEIQAPGFDGEGVNVRVLQMTVSRDVDGLVTDALVLNDIIRTRQEKAFEALKKMTDGTVGGDSKVAQPAAQVGLPPSSPDCCAEQTGGGGGGG